MWKGPSSHLKSIDASRLQILLNKTEKVILAKMLEVFHDSFILEDEESSASIMSFLPLQLSPYLDL